MNSPQIRALVLDGTWAIESDLPGARIGVIDIETRRIAGASRSHHITGDLRLSGDTLTAFLRFRSRTGAVVQGEVLAVVSGAYDAREMVLEGEYVNAVGMAVRVRLSRRTDDLRLNTQESD